LQETLHFAVLIRKILFVEGAVAEELLLVVEVDDGLHVVGTFLGRPHFHDPVLPGGVGGVVVLALHDEVFSMVDVEVLAHEAVESGTLVVAVEDVLRDGLGLHHGGARHGHTLGLAQLLAGTLGNILVVGEVGLLNGGPDALQLDLQLPPGVHVTRVVDEPHVPADHHG